VTLHLRELALPAAAFTIDIASSLIDSAAADFGAIGDDGADDVTFLLAPNPASPRDPGEGGVRRGAVPCDAGLRVVLSERRRPSSSTRSMPGSAAKRVPRSAARSHVGRTSPRLCVTHLPQVAAFADAHLLVTKDEVKGRTVAAASLLLDDARVNEISRMLAGVGGSAHARRHAL